MFFLRNLLRHSLLGLGSKWMKQSSKLVSGFISNASFQVVLNDHLQIELLYCESEQRSHAFIAALRNSRT
eukprot:scaffold3437_cov113-Cylindrotheca_fusiformis.AAC.50